MRWDHLYEAILSNRICVKRNVCNELSFDGQINNIVEYSDIIFVDTFINEEAMSWCLDHILKCMEFNETPYFLKAAIEFQLPAFGAQIGHFVTFAKRNDWSWEIYNDLNDKTITVANNSLINITLLVYSV